MPPNKKQRKEGGEEADEGADKGITPKAAGGEEADEGAAKSITPKEAHFQRLGDVIRSNNLLGSMLVVGVERNDDSDEDADSEDDEDEKKEEPKYTAEEMAKLRHILINESRDKALKKGHAFASCGQCESGLMTFNTSSGNTVILSLPGEIKKALKKKTQAERFDALLGLTHGLKEFDYWMNDNECWGEGGDMEKAVGKLAKAWRDTLRCSDAELDIDAEYTRPGIEALLDQFADDLEGLEGGEYEFNWRP